MPKFSIITVSKNNASGLARTLSSVLALDAWPLCELIIVDGKSSDNSRDLAEKILCGESRARFITESRPGIFSAMNEGVAMARGDWIVFMNSGDYFAAPTALNGFDPSPDTLIVMGQAINYEKNLAMVNSLEYPWQGMPACHQAIFFKASIAKRRPYKTQYVLSADFEWLLWAQKNRLKSEVLNHVVAANDSPGVTYTRLVARVLQCFLISLKYYPFDRNLYHFYFYKLRWAVKEQKRRRGLS